MATCIVAASIAGLLCEGTLRWLDGQQLLALRLSPPTYTPRSTAHLVPTLGGGALGTDIDPAWLETSPPPARRPPIDPELERRVRRTQIEGVKPFELTHIWNRSVVRAGGCVPNSLFAKLPQPLLVFDAPRDGPPFRYPASRTLPGGLATNRFGWRGPDLPLDKPPRTIRLAFVGASTTVGFYWLPFSYPEYVIHWLNLWAAKAGVDVRFDGLNAGREGLSSENIAGVIRDEVLPMEPDLIVYYEGANESLCTVPAPGSPPPPSPGALGAFVDRVVNAMGGYLESARRVGQLQQRIQAHGGDEPPKPAYPVHWVPDGIDEQTPDITRSDLPEPERHVLASLDRARAAIKKHGSELALSSFVWLVFDGLHLDPLRDEAIYTHLNQLCWPYRYADLRRALDLHNHLLEQYAAVHHLPFIDTAATFPNDPVLFGDAIHLSQDGTRAQAWIVFRALVPLVRARLESGAWPRPDRIPLAEHPNIHDPEPLTVRCTETVRSNTPAPTPSAIKAFTGDRSVF